MCMRELARALGGTSVTPIVKSGATSRPTVMLEAMGAIAPFWVSGSSRHVAPMRAYERVLPFAGSGLDARTTSVFRIKRRSPIPVLPRGECDSTNGVKRSDASVASPGLAINAMCLLSPYLLVVSSSFLDSLSNPVLLRPFYCSSM